MKIITWNFHCVPVPFGCPKGHIEKVAAYAAALVQQHDADILVLNEAFVAAARDRILAELRRVVGPFDATPSDVKGVANVGSGVVVAWRTDRLRQVGSTHRITYRNCCQFDCLSAKGGLHLPLQTRENVPLHIVATHMQAYEIPLLCDGVRATQIEALKKMVEALIRKEKIVRGEAVIYCGDFNQEPSGELESQLGASHVTCHGNCQTHNIGEVDHFFIQGGPSGWRQSARSRIAHASRLSNPSDHEPLLMESDLR